METSTYIGDIIVCIYIYIFIFTDIVYIYCKNAVKTKSTLSYFTLNTHTRICTFYFFFLSKLYRRYIKINNFTINTEQMNLWALLNYCYNYYNSQGNMFGCFYLTSECICIFSYGKFILFIFSNKSQLGHTFL